MADPCRILGVSADMDEASVRRRYLQLVRQYPPEKCPQQFAEIRAAYEQMRDPARRLERQLFDPDGHETLDDVIADLRTKAQSVRIPTEVLLSLAER